MRRQNVLSAGLLLLLAGCVPLTGDYSEFALKPGAAPADTRQKTNGYVGMNAGRYSGDLKGGFPDGSGTFVFNDGRTYTGDFSRGRFSGKGVMTYGDGRKVTGTYDNDAEKEVVIEFKGLRFEGVVSGGRPAGKGVITGNGTLAGHFDGWTLQGQGFHADSDGSPLYSGPYVDGRRHGQGICPQGVCEFNKGQDVTRERLRREAESMVENGIDAGFDSEKKAFEERHAREQASLEKELSRQRARKGPEDDDECRCALLGGCLGVTLVGDSSFERAEEITPRRHGESGESYSRRLREVANQIEHKRRLEGEQHLAMCRARYAEWMGKPAPTADERAEIDRQIAAINGQLDTVRENGRRDLAEIERRRRQAQADREEKERLIQAREAQIEAERRAKLQEDRAKCDAGVMLPYCRCDAIYAALGPKSSTGSHKKVVASGSGARTCMQ